VTPSQRQRSDGGAATTDPAPLSIVQVVRSDAFAGVERYICQVANGLVSRGHRVVAIGGDRARMRSELSDAVDHRPATSVSQTARALVKQRGVDVVHVHMTAAEAAAWLAHPVQRAPIVATRHFAGDRGSGTVARTLARATARTLSCDIAISQFVADSIEGPSVLLYNGVSDRAQAGLASSTVVMLQRLTAEKSPELGLRAWRASGLGTQGWRLAVAGVGDLRSSLTALARDLDIAESVDFIGQVADTDQLLSQSAILLAPAPEEPFGLSVVEAMAHGVPVVGAKGGAHVETIGDDGLLFAPGDSGAAAHALVTLANDIALRRQVGAQLRERQRGLFGLAHHLDRLESVYRDVLGEVARSRNSRRSRG
jgi:glycosyltransferase involved in cell wall biosynthesis